MITKKQFQILTRPEIRELIDKNIDADPMRLALSKSLPHDALALICDQIKYLSRAKIKFPQLFAARAIIPSLAFEQSSSDMAASLKNFNGKLCIDLTCGLGIDTINFAHHFSNVISVEIQEPLADIVRYNMALLSINNVDIVCDSAENFVSKYSGELADLIYVDPDRRGGDGKKLVLLQDCSPNVVELMPQLLKLAKKVVVKISPLFDVDELFRIFNGQCSVEIISISSECKEVLLIMGDDVKPGEISIVANRKAHTHWLTFDNKHVTRNNPQWKDAFLYMLIPDVAIYKARTLEKYFMDYPEVYISSQTGFCFADQIPKDFCGSAYQIVSCQQYKPKQLKVLLSKNNIRRATILKRDFAQSVSQIIASLKIKEGGETFLAFTTISSANSTTSDMSDNSATSDTSDISATSATSDMTYTSTDSDTSEMSDSAAVSAKPAVSAEPNNYTGANKINYVLHVNQLSTLVDSSTETD